ncbi:MAG TPA: signal peptidase I [Frankiaceae bacterium]|jgi:signal peptidase|nr:signal peptidase I [Frankiaceae bacterium]
MIVAVKRAGAALLLLVPVAALAVAVAARTDSVRFSRVLTGSMNPVVPPGALVVSRPVEATDIAKGDVVVFMPPAPFGQGTPVVHRVVDVTTADGNVLVRTKGDANPAEDPWTLDASRSTVYRHTWSSPMAGRVVGATGREGLATAVGAVGVVAALRVLVAIWRPRRGERRASGLTWLRDAAA